MINLRNKDQIEILKIAKTIFSTEVEIWAYGSRVNGNSHNASDLDIVLRSPGLKQINISELEDFKKALTFSNIPIIIQVFDWARLPKSFHENILKSYHKLIW